MLQIEEARERLKKLRQNHDWYKIALELACEYIVHFNGSCPYEVHDICPRELYEKCNDSYVKCWVEYFYTVAKGESLD